MNAIKFYLPLKRSVEFSSCIFISLMIIITALPGCTNRKLSQDGDNSRAGYIDTTVSVYGPYAAIKLHIDKGVKISNPIQIAAGPDGVMYAANQTGEVYSLQDTNADGLEDMALLYCNVKDFGLRSPAGFTFRGDTIYIGTAQQIRAFRDTDKDGKADTSWTFFAAVPHSEHPYEWTNALNFGPDGWLYCTLTTDSWNAAPSPDPEGYRGSIIRISPNGKKIERLATGIRSVYGMNFSPYGDLFFTDNEGGGNPTEELNRYVKNEFYGHNPQKYKSETLRAPEIDLRTEVAPSGIEFNKSDNDFGGTAGNLFVAFYGPGERWTRGGIGRIVMKRLPDGNYSYEEIPVADIPKLSDLAFGKEGALYVTQHGKADYWYNAVYENEGNIYKFMYDPSVVPAPVRTNSASDKTISQSSMESGQQLFSESACLGCHQVDGVTELLGPNLKGVAGRLTREDILEEILEPSARIKPSMMALRVTKKNGQVLIGRVVNADGEQISLMMVGNHIVKISRREILKSENEKKSLMYDGLLNGLSDGDKENLLNYIVSLRESK